MIEKHTGKMSRGCELCFEGLKSVLFITGKCPRNCQYCPLSEAKKNKDVMHINELKTREVKDIIKEVKESNSSGVGITGGDPLAVLERTCKAIKKLKRKFGRDFHIHLYTSLTLISEERIKKLQKAGLDEIRVHPDIFENKDWDRIKLLKGKFSEVGIEIPVFPGEEKKVFSLIEYSKDLVDFYNLNQLEYATLYEKEYKKKGWKVNEDYSVKGSEDSCLKIIKKFPKLRIHYCSSNFKDVIQFRKRILERAKNVAERFDKIDEEGLLVRGAVHVKDVKNLRKLRRDLKKEFKSEFKIDKKKKRVIFNSDLVEEVSKKFKNCAIVEEYPTVDGLETEKEFFS